MCLGPTHAVAGAAACAFTAVTFWNPGPLTLAAGIVLCAGTGIANDIDHPDSTIEDSFGPVTWLLSGTVRFVTHGVPRRTHSVPVLALATVLAWWQLAWYRGVPTWVPYPYRGPVHATATVVLALTLAVLLSGAVRALCGHWLTHAPFGPHVADIAGLLTAIAVVRQHDAPVFLSLLVPSVAFGMGVHIILDSLTEEGCPWLWPLTPRSFHLSPKPLLFHTGHGVEKALRVALTLSLAYLLIIWTGGQIPGWTLFDHVQHHHYARLLEANR